MAYASNWNTPANDGDNAFAYELQSPERDEVLRLRTPRYMLEQYYDRTLRLSVARLSLMTVPREGWKRLDENIVAGDDSNEDDLHKFARSRWPGVRALLARDSVRRMREARRAARGLFW